MAGGLPAALFDLEADADASGTLDPFEEDTVFLAPRLDFTPGGARGDGAEADSAGIESPFATPRKRMSAAPASGIRPVWSADRDSEVSFDPASRAGKEKPLARRRARQVETGLSEPSFVPRMQRAPVDQPAGPSGSDGPLQVD
ncbi:MAG: hypothetical protein HC871_14040, partial [Rhizobiales bacterium]|nr:hypothetical protein [Hyphomicrobiales bacterium]